VSEFGDSVSGDAWRSGVFLLVFDKMELFLCWFLFNIGTASVLLYYCEILESEVICDVIF
jgi:hypothetical protein